MFKNLGKFLNLKNHDGAVDVEDTKLDFLNNFDTIDIKNIEVRGANHIPLPYIKAIFELEETVSVNYGFLKILLKNRHSKKDGINLVQAVMRVVMKEMGLDLEKFMREENYSVIDYFADNPVLF